MFLKHAVLYCFVSVCDFVTPRSMKVYILYIDCTTNLNLHFISTVTLLILLYDATEQKCIDNDHSNTSAIWYFNSSHMKY